MVRKMIPKDTTIHEVTKIKCLVYPICSGKVYHRRCEEGIYFPRTGMCFGRLPKLYTSGCIVSERENVHPKTIACGKGMFG